MLDFTELFRQISFIMTACPSYRGFVTVIYETLRFFTPVSFHFVIFVFLLGRTRSDPGTCSRSCCLCVSHSSASYMSFSIPGLFDRTSQ
ncbi:hypothetical protein PHET_09670 [Paragonimus heterotremus]|uniref:Uncharacterized protein n=1 Tax=Paragonimus heterotremus TaxID=100268 RepID=A0A8J4WNE6_9TREM|nr:hypothetical protein PHET_09670 [Paragonimus heterotremus]